MTARRGVFAAISVITFLLTACANEQVNSSRGQSAGRHPGGRPAAQGGAGASVDLGSSPFPLTTQLASADIPSTTAVPLTVFGSPSRGTEPPRAGITCTQWIVLASTQVAYTDSEIREMANSLAGAPNGGLPANLPPTLRYSPGSRFDDPARPCLLHLQITNSGQNSIQISQVGLHLIRPPEPNREKYPLIEVCSVLGMTSCGPQRGGAPTGCDLYNARVQLSDSSAAAFVTVPAAWHGDGSRCPDIVLDAGKSIEIEFAIYSAQPLIFYVEPILILTTSAGRSSMQLSQFVANAVFANSSQFTCLKLQRGIFSVAWSGPEVFRQGRTLCGGHLA